GDEARVDGGDVNATAARRTVSGAGIAPGRHAATGEVAIPRMDLHLGVESPARLPRGRVDREDASKRGGDVHRAIDDDRRHFERRGLAALDLGPELAGVEGPRHLQ